MNNQNSISETIWTEKYKYVSLDGKIVDNTVDDTWHRVARALSSIEPDKKHWEDEFYRALEDFKFIPAGRILTNAGTGRDKATMLNCYVSSTIEDSMESIFDILKEAVLTQKQGGGIGFDFSTLRPGECEVKGTHVRSSGPISFMKIFDASCRTIRGIGNRRGAQMAIMRCDHPDIEKFISAKHDGSLQMFNMSVAITDKFMAAVKTGTDWDLVFNGQIFKTIKARDLWNLIMQSTYDYAEPGVLFIDRVNQFNNLWYCETIAATNPCVTGDTLLITDRGLERFDEFVSNGRTNAKTMVENGEYYQVLKYYNNGEQPVFKVVTESGYNMKVTADHKFVIDGKLKRTDELNIGDKVELNQNKAKFNGSPNNPINCDEAGELLGWLVGDGYISRMPKGRNQATAGIIVGKFDYNIEDTVQSWLEKCVGERARSYHSDVFNCNQLLSRKLWKWAVNDIGITPAKAGHKRVPKYIFTAKESVIKAFIRGLFSADGKVLVDKYRGGKDHHNSVVLSSKSKKLLEDVQIIFAAFGYRTNIINRSKKPKVQTFSDGKSYYCTHELYELFLNGKAREFFVNEIGFTNGSYKTEKLNKLRGYKPAQNFIGRGYYDKIVSIEPCGNEVVYDFEVDYKSKLMISNGMVTLECAEQPLPPNGACLLGSINLTKFIIKPFSDDASIDYTSMGAVLRTAVRMLDNVIDISKYPTKEQERTERNKRRIGIGMTGLADILAFMSIKYGSEESVKLASKLAKFIKETVYEASALLAKEKGAFKEFDAAKYISGKFVSQLPDHIIDLIKQHGIRNSHLTSVAPTGTISLFAGNISSGIEPIFLITYVRKIKNPDDTFREENVIDYAAAEYQKMFGTSKIPDYFITIDDITPKHHVDIQAACQEHIDSSISKTVNVLEEITFDKFKHVYMYAYDSGCKGCTTFRPNPKRSSILSKISDKPTPSQERPDTVRHHVYKMASTNDPEFLVFVGLVDDRPFEIFAGSSKDIKIPIDNEKFEYYVTRRRAKFQPTKYDLYIREAGITDDDMIVKDIVRIFNNARYSEMTRMMSIALSSGAPAYKLIEALTKDKVEDYASLNKVLARSLKKYINDGQSLGHDAVCSKCNTVGRMVYTGGCPTCLNCGESRCN